MPPLVCRKRVSCMKIVIVRRNRAHRSGVRFLGGMGIVVLGCAWGFMGRMDGMYALLYGPLMLVLLGMVWAFDRWKVVFSSEGICWKGKVRPWTQVERVWADWTHGDQAALHIRFRDGRTLHLRMIGENMEQARKMICSRCSIEDRIR